MKAAVEQFIEKKKHHWKNAERTAKIMEMRKEKKTLAAISRAVGVSSERVRQIIFIEERNERIKNKAFDWVRTASGISSVQECAMIPTLVRSRCPHYGITILSDFANVRKSTLLEWPGVGPKLVQETQNALAAFGITLLEG